MFVLNIKAFRYANNIGAPKMPNNFMLSNWAFSIFV